jgi:hypothetical protein
MSSWNDSSVFYKNPTRRLAILLKPGFTTHQEITAMGRHGKEKPNKSLKMDFFQHRDTAEKALLYSERASSADNKI